MDRRIITLLGLLLLGLEAPSYAFAGTVEVQSIQIVPAEATVGKHPEITGTMKTGDLKVLGETVEVNIIATVTRPDNAVKSWKWDRVVIKVGDTKSFAIPKEYDVKSQGVYKVDFNVYSKDMRPLHRLSKSFTVVDPSRTSAKTTTPQEAAGVAKVSAEQEDELPTESRYFGLGVMANTANPAGGATMLLWPFKYAGLQANYTVGSFTTIEGRLLGRFPLASGINPYAGVGYLSVSTERTVDTINIKTTFKDTSVSGVLGVEIPLGKGWFGYVEVSGTAIDLKKEVTSGGVTGTATVKYAPVTVGLSMIYFAF